MSPRDRPITVAVGQFGSVIGQGLLQILGDDRGLRVLGAGLDRDALELAAARGEAEVLVLDEDSAATPAVPTRLRGARADVGLVVLAHRPTRAYAARVLACGVSACLSTETSAQEIVQAVRLAADGRHVFVSMSPRAPAAARAAGISALTRRERDVLELLGEGQKNAQIASTLNISTETVRMHAKHVYRKLGVSSRRELLDIEV
jgi:DNA-binding NarL/FixJ family response regulator